MSAERSSERVGEIELVADSVEEADSDAGRARAQPARLNHVRDPEDPFGILVVGDFRGVELGASAEGLGPLGERTPVRIDRDNFDRVLQTFSPSAHVLVGEDELAVRLDFRSRRDFDPDRLLERAPQLRALAKERERIESGDHRAAESTGAEQRDAPADTGEGSLLDSVLSATPGGDVPPSTPARSEDRVNAPEPRRDASMSDLEAFVRRAVRPHRVDGPDAGVEAALEAVDRERATLLRELLHDPRFQTLESRWRALELLVHRLDTGVDLKVFVLQVGPDELRRGAADGTLQERIEDAADEQMDGVPWSTLLFEHAFRATGEELDALHGLAGIAEQHGSCVLAEADPSLLDPAGAGGNPLVAKWSTLRTHPGARRIGLLLPRFLLREPYAPGENPVEGMDDFREFDEGSEVEPRELLWGNAGYLAAVHLGECFRRDGWEMDPGRRVRVDRLPIALHPGPDGTIALPSTEITLDGSAIQELAMAGFIGAGGRPGEGAVGMPAVRALGADGPPWG